MSLQKRIDEIAYPPTYQYDLGTLTPKGTLVERMLSIPSEMFHGESFLDIGCNKGFFSLKAKKNCKYVEGFDHDENCVILCKDLGLNVSQDTFRDYIPTRKFDRIMMGNVMHYMYKECGDWTFIIKLAAISNGLVLIEAPTGMDCTLMKPVMDSKKLRKNFNEKLFLEKMGEFFELISKVQSPTKNRWIMLFKRKFVKQIPFGWTKDMKIIKKDKESTIYQHEKFIIKIQNNTTIKDEIRIFIAAHSPISNGMDSFVYNYGQYCGWTEKRSDLKQFKHHTNQKECLQKLYEHNVYLAKLGCTEMDLSVVNFFEDFTFYDKGGVRYIKELQKGAIENIKTGWFFKMFKQSFNVEINYELIHTILNKRKSIEIEILYDSMLDKKKLTLKEKLFGQN